MPTDDDTPSMRSTLSALSTALGAAGIPDASLEARIMAREAAGITQEEMLAGRGGPLSADQVRTLSIWLSRRLRREPLQYITGSAWFYGRRFTVDSRVLIPRPETELLVEQALTFVRERGLSTPVIADIATGSGALAVTLACEMPSAKVIATDISEDALEVARVNAEAHGAVERVEFCIGNLLEPLSERCDIILCNPPYVLSGYMDGAEAQPELAFEPRGALDGGADGMDVLRPLIRGLPDVLTPSGSAAFIEIDPPVAEQCVEEAKKAFPSGQVSVLTDLAGLERCLVIEQV